MAVDQTNVVDFISIDRETGTIVLSISDHLDWEDDEHIFRLQDKLDTYINFIESGQLYRKYPDMKGKNVKISILFKFQPNATALHFLGHVREVLENSEYQFNFLVATQKDDGETNE